MISFLVYSNWDSSLKVWGMQGWILSKEYFHFGAMIFSWLMKKDSCEKSFFLTTSISRLEWKLIQVMEILKVKIKWMESSMEWHLRLFVFFWLNPFWMNDQLEIGVHLSSEYQHSFGSNNNTIWSATNLFQLIEKIYIIEKTTK